MDGFEEFEGEDFEEMPLDKKIDAMTYAIRLVLKAIGPEDEYYARLFALRNTWLIRGGTERMRRTGIDIFTGRPLDVAFPALGVRGAAQAVPTAEHPYHDKRRMLEEWRESSAFQDVRESFAGVPIISWILLRV